jgi:S1-C subfamily serine protease
MTNTPPKQPRSLLMMLLALVAGFIGGRFGSSSSVTSLSNANSDTKQQIVSTEEDVIASTAETVGKSVVSITVSSTVEGQDFFGFRQSYQQQGAGTGIIISNKGIIITNKHVVAGDADSVSVTLVDGTVLDASVIARDTRNDVAFIKITDTKGKELVPAKLGDSGTLKVGQKVIAIGNALGEFQNTVTSGIVSGYGREITAGDGGSSEDLTNLIQTDAAINQGNSGGPLVNLSGEVIGINTAITSSASGQSLGFAIPVNDIKAQMASVLEKGKIERPYLGVRYRAIDERYAFVYNLPVQKGAYLAPSEDGSTAIIKGSPADKAGLEEKDIITKIDDTEIDEKNDLVTILSSKKVGDVVRLTVLRVGKELSVSATLEVAPGE